MVMNNSGLRFAVVCRHNMNRSVQVHRMMKEVGLEVDSYGTENRISLPGPVKSTSIKFKFGTTYKDIYDHLVGLNSAFYNQIKVLEMLEKNISTKSGPEQFQESDLNYDVIITLDPSSQASVINELQRRPQEMISRRIQLVHMEVEDELENIRDASHHAAVLALMLQESNGDFGEIELIIERFNDVSQPDGYIATYSLFEGPQMMV